MRTLYLTNINGEQPRTIAIGHTLHVGRGLHNGLVLNTPDVSWSHSALHIEDGELIAEDLGSRNGTFVDGERIDKPTRVGKNVRIGDYLLAPRSVTKDYAVSNPLLLEEVRTHIRYPLGQGTFVVGDAAGANIRVTGAAPQVLTIQGDAVTLDDTPLTLPWGGTLGGLQVRVFQPDERWSPTLPDQTRFQSRRLRVALNPPQAEVIDLTVRKHHTITAPNRVSLLYFLAHCSLEDKINDLPAERLGWRSDEEVAVAVWGRSARGGPRNRLNTLTYRLRSELTEHGLSDALLQKKAGWVRLHGCDIELF